MAEKIDKTLLENESMTSFNAPIPGESLTSSPETPKHGKDHLNILMKIKQWKNYI